MTVHRKQHMISQPYLPFSRRLFLIPALTVALWLFLQKGCVLTPDISPAGMRIDVEVLAEPAVGVGAERTDPVVYYAPLADAHSTSRTQKPKNRSLQHASNLLRKAAVLLDQNDRSAIRLILQAVAILKHEIMREADAPEYDRVSVQPPVSHGGALPQESPAILCRPEGSSSRDSRIAVTRFQRARGLEPDGVVGPET